jgi:peptidoglycan/LPS O-acetylase OafA/YrhL
MIEPHSPAIAPRIAYLESIRGLSALQVILLHFFTAFAPDLVFPPSAGLAVAGYIHLSPLYFLYDGYSAVYVFFALSGYVLSRSFERHLAQPFSLIAARVIRLGVPAIAATAVAAIVIVMIGRPNAQAGVLTGSDWFARQWNPDVSIVSMFRDGVINALFLGYSGLPGVAFLASWQQGVEQSFAAPLWTLSIEFYGSMIVLALCWSARRSRALWWTVVLLGCIFTIRSAYICFFVGHVAAAYRRAEKPVPERTLLPIFLVIFGVYLCVLAEVWQPEWLRSFCNDRTLLLFPGQFPPLQQKTFGAIFVLAGLINLRVARTFLSNRWLVARSQLSFPLYLIHWPVLFGPAAVLFLFLHDIVGVEIAGGCAIVVGITLAVLASTVFRPVDRFALDLSRRTRKLSDPPRETPLAVAVDGIGRAIAIK